MANQEHLKVLKQGTNAWHKWLEQHPKVQPDLSGAILTGAILTGAILRGADLSDANLSGATLVSADLVSANLSRADLSRADLLKAELMDTNLSSATLIHATLHRADLREARLRGANLSEVNLNRATLHRADLREARLRGATLHKADLSEATLHRADLSEAALSQATLIDTNLSGANLSGANLNGATLVRTNLTEATLTKCRIYGISAWSVELTGATQNSLVITPGGEPEITVDNLKIAQFIYLLLNNKEIRDVINTLTTKAVLILGRFTPERKAVLDALREALRQHNYLPMLFDFDKPASRDITETVSTLAHLARFIIVDLTDPSSIPQELQAIVPTLAIPVQPILLEGKREYSMFVDFPKTYHWVLPIHYYRDQANLLAKLIEKVIEPAEQKAKELEKR
jgi:uncharacterized protein YjbI with pentapeptide repeats